MLLTITLKLIMILLNMGRKVFGYILINISPSNIFLTMLLSARFCQNCLAAFSRCMHDQWANVDFRTQYSYNKRQSPRAQERLHMADKPGILIIQVKSRTSPIGCVSQLVASIGV